MEKRPWQRHYDYNVPTTIRYPQIPAYELINLPGGSFPNKPATNFYGTEIIPKRPPDRLKMGGCLAVISLFRMKTTILLLWTARKI